MTIHLHLGAHKTASTHLQATFRENAARLGSDGVRLVLPSEVRRLAGPGRRAAAKMAPLPSLRAFAAERRLARLSGEERRLIVMDENSLGLCAEVIGTGALYPSATARLRVLRRLSGMREATVWLSTRDYAAFFAGVHAQSIRDAAAMPLSEAKRARLAALPRRWPDIVADIRKALPGAKIVMWDFADYAALYPTLLAQISGREDLRHWARRPMPTPRADAMKEMFALAASRPGGDVLKGEYAAFAERRDGPPYMPFTEIERKDMSAAYAEDLARLRADPSVQFLTP